MRADDTGMLPEILSHPKDIKFGSAWGSQMQSRVELYMEYLRDSVDAPAEYDLDGAETLSGYPYCGCSDCESREIMYATALEVMLGAGEGLIELCDKQDGDRG